LFLLVEIPFEILEQPPTDRDINRIATQVIKSSLLFSVHLGIEASFWLELKEDSHTIVNINRSILYKWRNEHPGKAKCRELAQALCNVDMNIDAILSDVYSNLCNHRLLYVLVLLLFSSILSYS
jgi:hypothetical protein